MKKMMLLSSVAALAILVLGTSASAQTLAQKPMFATVACKGNTAVCVNLELYQKMAATNTSATRDAASQASKSASYGATNPVAARKARAAGGVENNPAEDGGGGIRKVFVKNADRQAKLIAENERRNGVPQDRVNRPTRAAQGERVRNRLLRRGDDPTNNNPFSTDRAASRPQVQPRERVTTPRERLNRANDRTLYMIRSREITRHRPTDF